MLYLSLLDMKVFFETYGCSHNMSDTETMKKNVSGEVVSSLEECDTVIINTCAVKDKTVFNLRKRIKELESLGKKVVLAGCLTQADKYSNFKEIPEIANYPMIGTNNISDIGSVLTGAKLQVLDEKGENPGITVTGKDIEIIPISTGCLNACTYCQTRLARGKLKSYSIEEIVSAVRKTVSLGTKIIYLTSQDNGCYGYDIGVTLVDLMRAIKDIEGDFIVRIGMANTLYMLDIIDDFLVELRSDRFFKFLHIPVQSCSDKVLSDMKREHSVADFIGLISKARSVIPDISIATDIIVGYPTEGESDFKETLRVLSEVKPDVINRSKYSARPSTYAASLKQLSTNEITRRSKLLNALVLKISEEKNKAWVGYSGECLVEALKQEGSYVCRNMSYKPVVVKGGRSVGERVCVRVVDSKVFHLVGEEC